MISEPNVPSAAGSPEQSRGSERRSWTTVASSRPLSGQHGPTYHRRGSLQLWQFLLALLNDPANQTAIVWTGRGMEFKLIEPEEVRKFNFILTQQLQSREDLGLRKFYQNVN